MMASAQLSVVGGRPNAGSSEEARLAAADVGGICATYGCWCVLDGVTLRTTVRTAWLASRRAMMVLKPVWKTGSLAVVVVFD